MRVNFKEFASLPDSNGQAARMMLLIDEPGIRRLFVNDMNGPLYTISYDGKTVTPYLNVNDDKWGVGVQFNGSERGVQSFALHPQLGGNMFMSDIGQNTVEEISPVTAGANLGWNVWEGSFKYMGREGVGLADAHSDAKITYPVVEYGQVDPLLQPNSAAIGGYVYRQKTIPQLTNKLLFGDNPSGEIFYVDADNLPKGGQDPIRRVLLNDKGEAKTLLQLIKEKNASQGKPPATRADLRFGQGPDGDIFILNKRDGTIRMLVP